MQSFPIDSLKENIYHALSEKDWLILKSSPGSGKTTRVPLFLAAKYSKKILVLEPRRLAAKLAAHYVAQSIHSEVGDKVGYVFKYENKLRPHTQIIFLTEGTFLRRLKSNPDLIDTDIVILDEFHERHLTTDIALSFLIEVKKTNPHLKIIIMSATIDSNLLESFLQTKVNTIILDQKKHPIDIHFLENNTLVIKETLEKKVMDAIEASMAIAGNVLVFLPGMFEIKKVAERIEKLLQISPYILHGDLGMIDFDQENFADLTRKKIILSTNIAESSVTIPGVRIVIDSGLSRTASIHPVTRLKSINLTKISKSSATQRAFRANREAKGFVYRLYSEMDFLSRNEFDIPEINRSDLSELIIQSQDFFNKNPNELHFLEPLNAQELKKAHDFLLQLSLLKLNPNSKETIYELTERGRSINQLSFPPRIATIILIASFYKTQTFHEVLIYLANWLSNNRDKKFVDQFISQAESQLNLKTSPSINKPEGILEQIFLNGFVDQIGKIRSQKGLEIIHRDGTVYKISPSIHHEIDPKHQLWIILDTDNKNEVNRMLPIEEEWLYELDYFPIEEDIVFDYSLSKNELYENIQSRIGAIILETKKEKFQSEHLSTRIDAILFLYKEIIPHFNERLNDNRFKRLYFLEKYVDQKISQFPIETWLKTALLSIEFKNENYFESLVFQYILAVKDFLDPLQQYDLERDLPLTINFSDRRKSDIHYDESNNVYVSSAIQDFYGMSTVPTILKGKEKLVIHLLGPHKRALQVTTDLHSFWNKAYKEMLNELKRDYPRHYWPVDPEKAKPILLLRQVT